MQSPYAQRRLSNPGRSAPSQSCRCHASHQTGLRIKPGVRRMGHFPWQQIDGGGVVEPRAALLPHGDHQRSVPARPAKLTPDGSFRVCAAGSGRLSFDARCYWRCAPRGSAAAAQLHERGVAFETVANAFVLAASRRLARPEGAAPLGTIRSLADFAPVIDEVLESKASRLYFGYLRLRLGRASRSSQEQ